MDIFSAINIVRVLSFTGIVLLWQTFLFGKKVEWVEGFLRLFVGLPMLCCTAFLFYKLTLGHIDVGPWEYFIKMLVVIISAGVVVPLLFRIFIVVGIYIDKIKKKQIKAKEK